MEEKDLNSMSFDEKQDYLYDTVSDRERNFLRKKKKVWTNDMNKLYESESDYKYNMELKRQKNRLKKLEDQYNLKKITRPHEKPIEEIIIESRRIFFDSIEILKKGKNPIKLYLSNDKNKFASSILFIMIGVILLLFATLMKNP
tara:strand:- start:876 stop:1307 length:432 start_codon:yes stop_codon:yes gene_type:complete